MTLARVIGTVVSTVKHPVLTGRKLLIVKPLDADGNPAGKSMVAMDTVQSGTGDTVLVIDEGNSARSVIGEVIAPVRTVIVGIVDSYERYTTEDGAKSE